MLLVHRNPKTCIVGITQRKIDTRKWNLECLFERNNTKPTLKEVSTLVLIRLHAIFYVVQQG